MERQLGEPLSVERSPNGTIEIWRPKRQWLVTRVRGRFEMPLADVLVRYGDEALKQGPVRGFHDWLGVDGYDIQVQVRLTSYSLSTFKQSEKVFIAAANPMVLLAVTTANLALGGVYRVIRGPDTLAAAFADYLSGHPARAISQ